MMDYGNKEIEIEYSQIQQESGQTGQTRRTEVKEVEKSKVKEELEESKSEAPIARGICLESRIGISSFEII
jgi:hypothetical protein